MPTTKNNTTLKNVNWNSDKVKKCILDGVLVFSAGALIRYLVDIGVIHEEEIDSGADACTAYVTFIPTKDDYEFVGWREDDGANATVLDEKLVDSDPFDLYAVFRKPITVTCYNNSTTPETLTNYIYANQENGTPPRFRLLQATKSGWTNRGWSKSTEANGSMDVYDALEFLTWVDITVYAIYYQEIFGEFYSGNDYYLYETVSGKRYYNSSGNTLNASITAPTGKEMSTGWIWRGWSAPGDVKGNADVAYNNGDTISDLTDDIKCYGLYYYPMTFTFYSGLNKGTAIPVEGARYYNAKGNTVNASITVPTAATVSGWTFRGWSLANDTAADTGRKYNNGDKITGLTSACNYYGLYYQTGYLYFNGNGSTGGSTGTLSGTRYHNSAGNTLHPTFTLPANGFSRNNYTFAGWSINGVVYQPGNTYSGPDITAYAQWSLNSYINGGNLSGGVSMSVIYEYCNYGEWATGNTTISGTTISNKCSDFYESSRYYLSRVLFNGISFVGRGQSVSITNTYYNKQIAEDGRDHSSNKAVLYLYNISTSAMIELGNIRYDGTKTFTVPNDGNVYTFCIELSTWAALSYATNEASITISQLLY